MLKHSYFRIFSFATSRNCRPDVLLKKHNNESFQKIHEEIPVVESFCIEVTGLIPVGSLKYDSDTGVFLRVFRRTANSCFCTSCDKITILYEI